LDFYIANTSRKSQFEAKIGPWFVDFSQTPTTPKIPLFEK
jgi:hypothetical protein